LGDADTISKMWEEIISKVELSTEARHYSKKVFDYLNTVTQLMMDYGEEPTKTALLIGVSNFTSMRSTNSSP
jgi:hypothetical protein